MKIVHSLFYADTIKLTIIDMIKLLFGKQIKISGIMLGLWRMPNNGSNYKKSK